MHVYVFDLEANGLLDVATVVHCGSFKNTQTGEVTSFRPDEIHSMLTFMEKADVLIGHNCIHYDFPLLKKLHDFEYNGQVVDTVWMSRMLYPDIQRPKQMVIDHSVKRTEVAYMVKEGLLPEGFRAHLSGPHSIEAWGYRLGHGKLEYNDWETFDEGMLDRCEGDVLIQELLFKTLKAEGEKRGFPKESFNVTFELMQILADSEQRGWPVDVPLAQKYELQLQRWMRMIQDVTYPHLPMVLEVLEGKKDGEVNWVRKPFLKSGKYSAIVARHDPHLENKTAKEGYVGGPFTRVQFRRMNLGSDDEVKKYLLDAGWIPEEWNYKKDPKTKRNLKDNNGKLIPTSPKLSQSDPFIGVDGKVGRLLAKFIQVRHRLSLIQGILKRVRPDGTVGQVITGIAATGRLKHSVIVNIPGGDSFYGKQCRKIFKAPDGYRIVGTDASSCQDRMLAARANNPELTRMLLEGDKSKGTDMHTLNTVAINERLRPLGVADILRSSGKAIGLGCKFGASDKKLGDMVLAPAKQAQAVGAEVREALAEVAPAQAELIEQMTKEWRSTAKVRTGPWGKPELYGGTIKGLDGRPVTINSEHTVLVYGLQSDEAIMMQYALVFLERKLKEKGWKRGVHYWVAAVVHDEQQVIVREDLAETFATLAEKSIEVSSNYLKLAVPQAGESEIGMNWYATH